MIVVIFINRNIAFAHTSSKKMFIIVDVSDFEEHLDNTLL